jgi:hypothetical protein
MNSDVDLERLLESVSEDSIRSLVAEVAIVHDVARYGVYFLLKMVS